MLHDKSERASTQSAIEVGQLVYTSFKKFGFRMLKSPATPIFIQKSFVDKIVNARWDPHSPPSADFRAAYVYQSTEDQPYTVFGWLYYDGQDDFGRSGVPYFLAYYQLGETTPEHLYAFLDCLEKGPRESISRHQEDPDALQPIQIEAASTYEPARLGVDIPARVRHKSQSSIGGQQPIDWFITQTSSHDLEQAEIEVFDTPVPEIVLTDTSDDQSTGTIQLGESSLPTQIETTPIKPPTQVNQLSQANQLSQIQEAELQEAEPSMASMSDSPPVKTQKVESTLRDFVNKTMGIQGVALISEEGEPIVSAFGTDENSVGILAGAMLYMTQVTHQELAWSSCEWVTLRGPDNYLMLRLFKPGVYLLIKSAKVPMGLLDGVVKRMINKLQGELSEHAIDLMTVGNSEPTTAADEASQNGVVSTSQISQPEPVKFALPSDIPELLKLVLRKEKPAVSRDEDIDIDLDEDITYRGRPTSS